MTALRSRIRRFLVPQTEPVSRDGYISADLEIRNELLALFSPSQALTIFDIGACEGEDSVKYSALFPNARVFAFEPVPSNFARCLRTIDEYKARHITVLPYALSDADGTASLHLSSGKPPDADPSADWDYGNKSSSLLEPSLHLSVHPWIKFDRVIEVSTRRLDSVCNELAVAQVDFVHLDVQGAELRVLEGAGDRLGDVTAIWLEVEKVPLYRGQPLADDIARFLHARGFRKSKDTVGRVSGDQLWVRV